MGACTLAHLHTKGSGLLVHLHLPEDDSARGGPCVDDVRRLAAAFPPPLDRLPVDRHHSAARVGGRDPRYVPQAGGEYAVVDDGERIPEGVVARHAVRERAAHPPQPFEVQRGEPGERRVAVVSAHHRDERREEHVAERVLPVVAPAGVRDGRHAIHYCIHSRLLLRCWKKEGNTPLTDCIL